jgi:endonuclease/exonuclease/phosphatase family metal-dependent hydrolase
MRLASYNVENLFTRPTAMSPSAASAQVRETVLAAHARVSTLLDAPAYGGHETEILDLLNVLGVRDDDDGPLVRLRQLRGRLLARHREAPTELAARGRSDWIGWVELKKTEVDEVATENTARVIAEVDADVLTVVEADNRPDLELFTRALLPKVGGTPYEQVMLVEGNDQRGIDVGILAREGYPLRQIRTHVFDRDATGPIFSRDCCEYHLDTPHGERLVVLANHFKSKGYSSADDPGGARRRERQARQVGRIYDDLLAEGHTLVAIQGDLNDDPASDALRPLLSHPGLRDVSEHEHFDWNHRRGTYRGGNERDKIDYVLLSDALFERLVGGGVFRKGVWRGPRTADPWEIFPTLTEPEHEASDHAAVYAVLDEP